jgi:hypothetical protein
MAGSARRAAKLEKLYVDYFLVLESIASYSYVIESRGVRGKLNLRPQPLCKPSRISRWLHFGEKYQP